MWKINEKYVRDRNHERVPKIYVHSKDNKKGAKEAKDTTIL